MNCRKRCSIQLDKLCKALRVSENGQRVLACKRQTNEFAAGVFETPYESSALGSHQGFRARGGQRFGDLDGRLLAAPGFEARHQEGARGHDHHADDPIGALEQLFQKATSGDYGDWTRQVPVMTDKERTLD